MFDFPVYSGVGLGKSIDVGANMDRKTSRFSRRAITIAVVSFLAMLGLGLGGYAYAAGTSQPGIGLSASGQEFFCIDKAAPHTMHVNPGLSNASCPAGTSGLNYPVSGAAVAAAVAPVLPRGVAQVNVTRGTSTATWAEYSTILGSPSTFGDNASGTFRMTCSDAQAPCKISVKAYATKAGVFVYPRLDVMRQDLNGGPETYCEYADGTNNDGAQHSVGTSSISPTPIPLGVGGSLDCGSSQVLPADGVVDFIQVPAGHYDISSTFDFRHGV